MIFTVNQDPVSERVHSPHVRRPVCVAEPAREGEQPAENLRYLAHDGERTESCPEHRQDTSAEFNTIRKLDAENGLGRQAVYSEKVNEVGRRQV